MRIFIAMSEKAPSQSSSKEDFEQLSAIEESMASIGIADLESEQGVILKDWSAQDFSHAYVRFRPHLERHAARFLRDPSQVEEVVQDAFLYLMTALPELDSEIGVLRFLKWKTKMLALDIIRINSKYSVAPIEDHEHYLEVANQDELGLDLERADDSAVVSLALAKLSPRQRQVIVETQLLEKPIETVAQDMGLSNNALRQLLHRARAAFKVALVGEAEVTGLPASAILTLAAKKAARDSGKLIAGASAFLLAIFGIVSFGSISVDPAETAKISMPIAERPLAPRSQNPVGSNEANADTEGESLVASPRAVQSQSSAETVSGEQSSLLADDRMVVAESQEGSVTAVDTDQDSAEAVALSSAVDEFVLLMDFATDREFRVENNEELVVRSGNGLTATFGLDATAENPVQFVYLTIDLPDAQVVAVPTNGLSVSERSGSNTLISYAATDFVVGDLSGALGNAASSATALRGHALYISFVETAPGHLEVVEFSFRAKKQI